mmetsp:Transcript_8569/g.17800  ORF Transcript_8569/g.17800 Transcript_8569/m.17800 type:complete len:460 (-) Transcript_8569:159-1538(-)
MYGAVETNADGRPLLGPRRGTRRSIFQNVKPRQTVLKTVVVRRRWSKAENGGVDFHPTRKSFFYCMLSPRSIEWQAVAFKWFITAVICADLFGFIMSTDTDLNEGHLELFSRWEAVTSWIFLAEYVLRLVVVTDSIKYGSMGPIKGRLAYMRTSPALLDALATFPYFLENFTGYDLPTLTYLRSFRLLRILKTQGFSEAIRSVNRVLRYNSEILVCGIWIGMGFVLITAVMMYYLRPRDEDHPQFKSLPATLFLATMMLTGQGGPDGGPDGGLPWYTSSVVIVTGVFSIGMFAIPASMLTWGFEGEAERLAKLKLRKKLAAQNPETSINETEANDEWSYSSDDYSTDEEYLNTIAGFEDESDEEEEEAARKAFNVIDHDASGTISFKEFLKYTKRSSSKRQLPTHGEPIEESLRYPIPRSSAGESSAEQLARLEILEDKVDENCKKLDRILKILEEMKS